jgi:hypothetical protein
MAAAKSKTQSKAKVPWKKPAPKKTSHTKLSPTQKAAAKRSAQKAGRPYPNLVDNMKVAKKKTSATKPAKKAAKKT